MIVVVPPQAAARVPVSKVSEATVPPNGISMWVWPSIPPGMTYLPVASMTRSAEAARSAPSDVSPGARTAAMRLAVDEDVGLRAALGGDDGAVLDQDGHLYLLSGGR